MLHVYESGADHLDAVVRALTKLANVERMQAFASRIEAQLAVSCSSQLMQSEQEALLWLEWATCMMMIKNSLKGFGGQKKPFGGSVKESDC
jgi:hypothetical protein